MKHEHYPENVRKMYNSDKIYNTLNIAACCMLQEYTLNIAARKHNKCYKLFYSGQ